MIVLHQFEISPFCDKIRRVLNFKQQVYEINEVPVTATLSIRRKNQIGKLPFIEHDGNTVADSTDIAFYLEQAFPQQPLIPAAPALKAQCAIIEDWADESLYFYEMYLRFNLPHNAAHWTPELLKTSPLFLRMSMSLFIPRAMRGILNSQGLGRKPLATVLAEVEAHIQTVDNLLTEGNWLVGDALTLADISVYSQFFCIQGAPEGVEIIQKYPRVSDWMTRTDQSTNQRATA